MKKPVPATLLCSSTARILTTAFAQRANTSFTSRLISVVDCGSAHRADVLATQASSTTPARVSAEKPDTPAVPVLEPERRGLITHRCAVEHIARRRCQPVSLHGVDICL